MGIDAVPWLTFTVYLGWLNWTIPVWADARGTQFITTNDAENSKAGSIVVLGAQSVESALVCADLRSRRACIVNIQHVIR